MKLSELITHAKLGSVVEFVKYHGVGPWNHFEWVVRITRDKRVHDCQYRTGTGRAKLVERCAQGAMLVGSDYGRPDVPRLAEVLCSLQSDCQAGDQTFESFYSKYGYDVDSIKARRTWRKFGDVRLELREFFGSDFEAFMEAGEE